MGINGAQLFCLGLDEYSPAELICLLQKQKEAARIAC